VAGGTVLAYDQATGFGLVQPLGPLGAARRLRSAPEASLTLFAPSAIVRSSPFAFRNAARFAHAPLAAHFAAPPAAFLPQAQALSL